MKATTFTADECQALCDVIEKLLLIVDPEADTETTAEELHAIHKLRAGARFYVPARLQ